MWIEKQMILFIIFSGLLIKRSSNTLRGRLQNNENCLKKLYLQNFKKIFKSNTNYKLSKDTEGNIIINEKHKKEFKKYVENKIFKKIKYHELQNSKITTKYKKEFILIIHVDLINFEKCELLKKYKNNKLIL